MRPGPNGLTGDAVRIMKQPHCSQTDSPTDEQLACQTQAGCSDAFARLMGRYQDRIAHFLYRRIGDHHEAAELAQETFIRAWRFRETYKPRWRYSTWLFTIAYRLSTRRRAQPAIESEKLAEHPAEVPGPAERLIADEHRRNLWATARLVLEDESYQALWLRYGEQMSVKETARVLGKTAVSVKVQLLRARRKLQPHLQPIHTTGDRPDQAPRPTPTPAPAGGAS